MATPSRTRSTMRRPAIRARTFRRASTAGIAALFGRPTPRASTMEAIVDAVPMMLQEPWDRFRPASKSCISASVTSPARY